MKKALICIVCPNGCRLSAELLDDGSVAVTGNTCPRGKTFALAELTRPMRSLTTTVRTCYPQMPVLPVRTGGEIPKEAIPQCMAILSGIVLDRKIRCGDIVLSNIAGTGCDVIATLDLYSGEEDA